MNKLQAFVQLLRKGYEVSNVEKWKAGQIGVSAILGLLAALYALVGEYDWMPKITDVQLEAIALGLLAVGNIVFTVITSKRAGVLPSSKNPPSDPPPVAEDGARRPAPAGQVFLDDNT